LIVGILRLGITIPESHSLKDKRSVMKSLKERIEARFRVSVAEVGLLDNHGAGELGIACVSNEGAHADEVMAKIVAYAEANCGEGYVSKVETELIHLG
jgi:uncharacterized protein YlxP (DUF503 family)